VQAGAVDRFEDWRRAGSGSAVRCRGLPGSRWCSTGGRCGRTCGSASRS